MRYTWWSWTYNPATREVAVQQWVKRSNCWAELEVEYTGLTWGEAVDVLDAASTAELLRSLGGRLD